MTAAEARSGCVSSFKRYRWADQGAANVLVERQLVVTGLCSGSYTCEFLSCYSKVGLSIILEMKRN